MKFGHEGPVANSGIFHEMSSVAENEWGACLLRNSHKLKLRSWRAPIAKVHHPGRRWAELGGFGG